MQDKISGVYKCLAIDTLVETVDDKYLEEVSFGSIDDDHNGGGFISMRITGEDIARQFQASRRYELAMSAFDDGNGDE